MNEQRLAVRMVFADNGAFHEVVVPLAADVLERHERLIDALREDPEILGDVHIDPRRLVTAYVERNR